MSKINLSKFKKTKRDYTNEDIENAIKQASMRRMEPGIMHDVKISQVKADSIKMHETNTEWIQWTWIFENAAGENGMMTFLAPLGQSNEFISKAGKPTVFPLASFGKMLTALGLADHRMEFIDRIVETDGEVLHDICGFQCRYISKWSKNKVHPLYDPDKQAWYVADHQGRLVSEEPFAIPSADEVQDSSERWAEMAQWAADNGLTLELGANPELHVLEGIINPLAQIGIGVKKAAPKPGPRAKLNVMKPRPPKPSQPVEEEEEETEETEYDPSEYE